ncbi:MAG: DUF4831 family protein [Muribaculaceae bacterium]|nr:DUF4831 family protein [Muribaculaceae bacterium]
MTLKALALASAAIIGASAIAPAQTSQKITTGKANDYALVYTLPRTAFDIYIEAELTEDTPGEFYNYARRHLGINNAITAPAHSASVRSITIVPRGVPDSGERWTAQFKTGTTASMTLSPDDIALAINAEGAEPAAGPGIPAAKAAAPSPLEGPAARQAVTQDMARSASASKKAELAAQRIFELRETRSDILSGQADNPPADGEAMKLVLDNLAAQEAALTAMFAGVHRSSTVVEKVSFVPDSADARSVVIARLSAVDGIVDADNLAGAPITLDFTILEDGKLPLTEKGEVKTFPKGGVAYRIPGRGEIAVSYGGKRIVTEEFPVAQLGPVFGLNPALFTDKKAPYSVTFDRTTGAVIELKN